MLRSAPEPGLDPRRRPGSGRTHQGLAALQATGTQLGRLMYLARLAEAYGHAGQTIEGLSAECQVPVPHACYKSILEEEQCHDLSLVSPPCRNKRLSGGRARCLWGPQPQTAFTDAPDT